MPLLTLMLLLLYVITVFTAVIVVVTITDVHTVALQKEGCSFTSDLGFCLGFQLGFHAKTRK